MEDPNRVNLQKEEQEKNKHRTHRLLIIQHASKCQYPKGQCPVLPDYCHKVRELWDHISRCNDKKGQCRVPHCYSSRLAISHFHRCRQDDCEICLPVRKAISNDKRKSKRAMKPTAGLPYTSPIYRRGNLKDDRDYDDNHHPNMTTNRSSHSSNANENKEGDSSVSSKKRRPLEEAFEEEDHKVENNRMPVGKKRRYSIDTTDATAGSLSIVGDVFPDPATCTVASAPTIANESLDRDATNDIKEKSSHQEQIQSILRHEIYSPPHSPRPNQPEDHDDEETLCDSREMNALFDLNFTFSKDFTSSPGADGQSQK